MHKGREYYKRHGAVLEPSVAGTGQQILPEDL